MKWKEYSLNFKEKFLEKGYTDEEIEKYLNYCKQLYDKNLPMILDLNHLSFLVGYDISFILGVINSPFHYYRKFNIKKKNGKLREINEPLPSLKEIQLWINEFILKKVEKDNKYITSYKSSTSIKDNAKFHKNQKNVLNIDIKDYFGSITIQKVYRYFLSLGYTSSLAFVLSRLCCYKNSLPQGAPTSPLLSNLVTKNLDNRLLGFARKINLRYSRYADDITFSGEFNERFIIKIVKKILEENGFEINYRKVRNLKNYQRQEVTGIIVNKKLQVSRQLRDRLRQEAYYIQKFGLDEHLKRKKVTDINYIYKLIGLTNFAIFINSNDKKLIKIKEIFYSCLNKER